MFDLPKGGERAVLVNLNLHTGLGEDTLPELQELDVAYVAEPVAATDLTIRLLISWFHESYTESTTSAVILCYTIHLGTARFERVRYCQIFF